MNIVIGGYLALVTSLGTHTLLLGVHRGDTYRTYKIAFDARGARISDTMPGIVVRRANALWHVNVTTVCEFDGVTNGTHTLVWDAPFGTRPVVRSRRPCSHRRDVRDCGRIAAQIDFVSPTIVATTETRDQAEECDPRGGRWSSTDQVRRLGTTNPLSIASFIRDSAADTYWRAVLDEVVDMQREGMSCPEPEQDEIVLTSWSVRHVDGAWRPMVAYNVSHGVSLGECEMTHPLAMRLPSDVTGDSSSDEAFHQLRARTSKLTDLFMAPGGACGVAVVNGEIGVYAITGDHLGDKLLDVDLPGAIIVSAQWL